MKKIYFYALALLFVVVLAGACVSKSTAPVEEAVVEDEQQVEVVDSLANAVQAEVETVETLTKELK